MLKNKKGFTLIELIIVVAIMAVLVALLAPNVLKYLEKSKVGKDLQTLDAVKTAFHTEITDEDLSDYCTDATYGTGEGENFDNKVAGKYLYEYEGATEGAAKLINDRIFGYSVLDEVFYGDEIFGSKAAKGGCVMVFLDGKGGIAVAAVTTAGTIAEYDGDKLVVAVNLDIDDLEIPAAPNYQA